MAEDIIDRLIAGTYPDPDGGPPLRVETRAVTIAKSLASAIRRPMQCSVRAWSAL
jgi:glycerol-1-phosphate dehydrogenase [NAD(P)+]